MLRHPTREKWTRAVAGLALDGSDRRTEKLNPDGSSASLDDVEGIRIGCSDAVYRNPQLPANLHDFRYWCARNHAFVPWTRQEADAEYRDGCLRLTSILIGWHGWKAKQRCWLRYYGLRVAGRAAYGHKWLGLGSRQLRGEV
jgi:hypothetical protein